MNSILRTTILFSLLLHLVLYVVFTRTYPSIIKEPPVQELTQEFLLVPQIEPPTETDKQNPDEPPPPKHMEDDPKKANTSDGLVESGSKTKTKKTAESFADSKSQSQSKEIVQSTLSENSTAKEVSENESSEELATHQWLEALDDAALDESVVESPLTSLEEERARWRNEVLKRISEQVNFAWVKPYGSSARHSGILKLEIGADGYLENVWVHLPSGDPNLDASILRAVRSIWRFQIPNSRMMNRYYRNLNLNYQGG